MSGHLEPTWVEGLPNIIGLSGRPLATAAEPIVTILKRKDFKDHGRC